MPALFSEGFLLGLSIGFYCLASCLPLLAPYMLAEGRTAWDFNFSIFLQFMGGRFAAYILVQRGLPVLMLERGAPVEKRMAHVQAFWEKGILYSSGNVLFGEGGAGTFSDGKLTSRSKNLYSTWVKRVFVVMGAPASIITDAKPHIGTDRLRKVVINFRN